MAKRIRQSDQTKKWMDGIRNMKLDKPKDQCECTNCLLKDERIAYLERLIRTMGSCNGANNT